MAARGTTHDENDDGERRAAIPSNSSHLSSYERDRLARIRRNAQLMRNIGLPSRQRRENEQQQQRDDDDVVVKSGARVPKRKRTDITLENANGGRSVFQEVRRSARLQLQPKVDYEDPKPPPLPVMMTTRMKKEEEKKKTMSTSSSSNRAPADPAPDSCRVMDAHIAAMMAMWIGKEVPAVQGFGGAYKASVMARLRDAESPIAPRFSKYSGVQEWRNCIVLFVNVGMNDYENVFYGKRAEKMAWFAQQSHSEETPVVKRLLRDDEEIMLFLRRGAGEAYVCCGRVRVSEVDIDVRPLKIVWSLRDHDALIASGDFRNLLEIDDIDDGAGDGR